MDRPVLHAFVRELLAHERLQQLAEALPTRARVSYSTLAEYGGEYDGARRLVR